MSTIRDVAKLAGVGIGTASRVISGKGSVSERTTAKVRAAMKTLAFHPNSVARSLSSRKLDIIGIWTTRSSGMFLGGALLFVEREIARHNRHCIITSGDDDTPDAAQVSLQRLVHRNCDGILVWGSGLPDKDLVQLEKSYPNIVVLNHRNPLLPGKCFCFDHYSAGAAVAGYLVELGHREIAIISPKMTTEDGQQRLKGFLDTLGRHDVKVDPRNHAAGDYTLAGGQSAAEHLLRAGGKFSALFCGNDLSAIAAIATLHKAGLQVPADVSVIGYDDHDMAAYTWPPLTTLKVPFADMAQAAARCLLQLCYDIDLDWDTDFPSEIVERDSCRRLAD